MRVSGETAIGNMLNFLSVQNLQTGKETLIPYWLNDKESTFNAGDTGSTPALGRFLGEGNDNLLQYLAWEILWTEEAAGLQSMGSQKSQAQLND